MRRAISPRGHLAQATDVVLTHLGLKKPRASPGRLVGVRRRSITLPGQGDRVLSWLESGTPGAPVVVLLHGTPGDAGGWGDYLAEPPPGLRMVAPDRLGFGHSAVRGPQTSLQAQADAIAACLAQTANEPAVVVGHSLGGAVAAALAARHPRRVGGLVLLAASLDPAQERIHPLQHVGRWPVVRRLLPRGIVHANEELFDLKRELLGLEPQLSCVRCPVWIVHGTRDALVPPANVAYTTRRLVSASSLQVQWLEGQGHFLPWRAQAAVRQALAQAAAGLQLDNRGSVASDAHLGLSHPVTHPTAHPMEASSASAGAASR